MSKSHDYRYQMAPFATYMAVKEKQEGAERAMRTESGFCLV